MPEQVPLVADRAYDSDLLREALAEQGVGHLAPHRHRLTDQRRP